MPWLPPVLGPYSDLATLEEAWRDLATQGQGTVRELGQSRQGRSLTAYLFGPEGAPVVLLTALIHGNEWIGGRALFGLAQELMLSRKTEALRSEVRLAMVPVVNPDAYAANAAKLLRGAPTVRRTNAKGVDLNRNFPRVERVWSLSPLSGSRFTWSPYYSGEEPLCEPESRAVAALAKELKPFLALGFHSAGGLLLFPWGYTRKKNPRVREYEALGRTLTTHQLEPRYRARQAFSFYRTVGDLDDWLDSELGTLAMTVEVSRLDRRLLHPRRLLNPFSWMNPVDVRGTVDGLTPGLVAMIHEARRRR